MQILNLEHFEEAQQPIRGGFVVNSIKVIVLSRSLASATALAYYGNAAAYAKAENYIGISIGSLPF